MNGSEALYIKLNSLAEALTLELKSFSERHNWRKSNVYLYSYKTEHMYFTRKYGFWNFRTLNRPRVAGFRVDFFGNKLSFVDIFLKDGDLKVRATSPRSLKKVVAYTLFYVARHSPKFEVYYNNKLFSIVDKNKVVEEIPAFAKELVHVYQPANFISGLPSP